MAGATTVPVTEPAVSSPTRASLLERYRAVRSFSHTLCEPLVAEDFVIQSMPDVSPTKWHLAHTSWFFETFLLQEAYSGYKSLDDSYAYLFNSYYNAVGKQFSRPHRGMLSRPTVAQVMAYREYVDRHMEELLDDGQPELPEKLESVVEIGLHHEQQHQELIVTDIKHVLSVNPLYPVYTDDTPQPNPSVPEHEWVASDGGVVSIGHKGDGFAYDNEDPRHDVLLRPFKVGSRLITCGEYIAFIEDGGYMRPEFWLSEGWSTINSEGWEAPLYWEKRDGEWYHYTLSGFRPVESSEPVTHVSYFEADAYAMWRGLRLPTEAEWETAAGDTPIEGNFVESGLCHPAPVSDGDDGGLSQLYGDVWEWTCSSYSAYPGYKAAPGALGEYNGKFMCNQYVLRGGSCATSQTHMRRTYRNFFPADARWQFSGIRLADDA